MSCPHLTDGRCGLAEQLALTVVNTPLVCSVSADQCARCVAAGEATIEKPSLQVTGAVTRACPPDHRRAWASYASRFHLGDPQTATAAPSAPPPSPPAGFHGQRVERRPGPGTCLAKTLKERYGVQEEAECACNSRVAEMNARGVDWCAANVETIVGWLLEEIERRRMWQRHVPDAVKRWKLRRLVREAIQMARTYSSKPSAAAGQEKSERAGPDQK